MRKLNNVTVRLTYPTVSSPIPGEDGPYAKIVVTDEASRIVLLEIKLPPTEAFSLFSSAPARGTAELSEHTDKVGRTLVVDRLLIPDGYGLRYDSTSSSRGVKEAVAAAEADGWEHVAYRREHGKHWLNVRKWVVPADLPGKEED